MVLYFTGTGNSRYIASRIAEALSEELFSINERIKAIDTSPVTTNERLILVTPTYAWRIPRIVRNWLLKTDFPAAKQVWFVMDCGSEIGAPPNITASFVKSKSLPIWALLRSSCRKIILPCSVSLRRTKREPSSQRLNRTFTVPLLTLRLHRPSLHRETVPVTAL